MNSRDFLELIFLVLVFVALWFFDDPEGAAGKIGKIIAAFLSGIGPRP